MSKRTILADNKTCSELLANAKNACNGGGYWPPVVLQLLQRIYGLELEMQTLRQQELFATTTSAGRPVPHE